jgi:SMC interacting uncharacterized protein involved in chromosome segregation
MEEHQTPDPEVLGTRVLSHDAVEAARKSEPTDYVSARHITCRVDLSPLTKQEELNFLRLRYNEYILQCVSGPFDVDKNLDERQEEMANTKGEIDRLKREIEHAEMERRNSGQMLEQEALDHQQTVDQLEKEVAALRKEIMMLKGGGIGAGMRRKIMEEVDGALQELDHLESELGERTRRLQVKNYNK